MAGVHLEQGHRRECEEHHQFNCQEGVLDSGRNLNTAIADVGHDDDPDDTRDRRPERAVGQVGQADESERVGTGDLRQVCHHDDVGGDDAPAAHPADKRSEGTRRPGEGGAAVRFGLVQFLVGHRDHVHRDERHQDDGRRLDTGQQRAAAGDDQAEARCQRICGCGGGHSDDDAGQQSESTALEALAVYCSRRRLDG